MIEKQLKTVAAKTYVYRQGNNAYRRTANRQNDIVT